MFTAAPETYSSAASARARSDGNLRRGAARCISRQLLFWPRDELTIDFIGLSLEIADREDGRVSLGGFFVEIVPEDED